MHRRYREIQQARFLLLAVACVAFSFLADHVPGQIILQGQDTSTGTIKSIAPGAIGVRTSQGENVTYKIQGKHEEAVSLGGAQAIVKMPAEVEVSGTVNSSALESGVLVRFQAQVSQLGRTQGEIVEFEIFDEEKYPLGIEVLQEPEQRGGYADCRITGEVQQFQKGRLLVRVPAGKFSRRDRFAFKLSAQARGTLESDDYQKARPGDEVTALSAARFSTGDRVIQKIAIRLSDKTSGSRVDAAQRGSSKYLNLSDEPSRPRDVRSAHFLLHTDISDRQAGILLDKLETMIALVSQYYGRPPAKMIECYVVRDLKQWPPGSLEPVGMIKIAEPAGVTITASLGSNVRSQVYSCDKHGVVQHESIHAYCSETFGSTGPTWYSEGMAEMGQYWKKGQRAVEVDPVVIDYLKNNDPKKMLDIVAAGQITGDSWQAYAWRWALCHLLANNPNYYGRFKALGLALMARQPGVSFESVYGPVARQISFEYDLFVQQVDNGYRADLCAWPWNAKFAPLREGRNTTLKVKANYGWQASRVRLEKGTSYDVAAKGLWKTAAGSKDVDAGGDDQGTGRLLGVVMNQFQLGEPFEIGSRHRFVAPTDGHLYVRCRDAWTSLADNEGEMVVYFRKTPAADNETK